MSSGSNDTAGSRITRCKFARLVPSFPDGERMAQHGSEPTPEAKECLVVEGAARLAVTDQLVGRHDTAFHSPVPC